MPDPIRPNLCPATPDVEGMLREATGLPNALVAPPPPASSHTGQQVAEGAVHLGTDAILHSTEAAGAGTAGGAAWLGAAILAPIAAGVGGAMMIVHADEEGRRRDAAHQSEVLRGALAFLEGRSGSPEVVAQAARSPGYAEGLRRMEREAATLGGSERLVQIAAVIRREVREGGEAVLRGDDRGECFEQRMARDPAFRHGVEHMRRLRDESPLEFLQQKLRLAEMDDQVAESRARQALARISG